MIIGGLSIIFLTALSVFFILALIAAPTLLNAADKAKEGAVKANTSAAASTVITYLTVDEMPSDQAIAMTIENLNNAGTPDYPDDDAMSPFNREEYAFGNSPGPGVVVLTPQDLYTVNITAYGKDGVCIIAEKTITAPHE